MYFQLRFLKTVEKRNRLDAEEKAEPLYVKNRK